MPFFICPNCKERSVDHDRLEELDNVPVACHHCGFGFLFELMDDYYPAPNAGLVVCDQEGRVLACGRGVSHAACEDPASEAAAAPAGGSGRRRSNPASGRTRAGAPS